MANPTEEKREQLLHKWKGLALDRVEKATFDIKLAEKQADALIGTSLEERRERNFGDEAAACRELATELEEINARLKMLILS